MRLNIELFIEDKNISLNYPNLPPDLELSFTQIPITRKKFYGPKDVLAIKVQLLVYWDRIK